MPLLGTQILSVFDKLVVPMIEYLSTVEDAFNPGAAIFISLTNPYKMGMNPGRPNMSLITEQPAGNWKNPRLPQDREGE